MEDEKPWYYSRTVWGSLVAVFAPLLAVFDVELTLSEQAELVETIILLVGAVGAGTAFVGRIFAKTLLHRGGKI